MCVGVCAWWGGVFLSIGPMMLFPFSFPLRQIHLQFPFKANSSSSGYQMKDESSTESHMQAER